MRNVEKALNAFLLLFGCLCLLYLSGCAVLDLSSMETAVPQKPGKVDASLYAATGLGLNSVGDSEVYHPSYPHYQKDDLMARRAVINGLKVNIGLAPRYELMARCYIYSGRTGLLASKSHITSRGYKLGIKWLWFEDGKQYFAIAPAINIINADEDEWLESWFYYSKGSTRTDNNAYHWSNKYNSYGYELQLLYTVVLNRTFTFTTVGRANVNHYKEDYREDKGGICNIYHGGARANMKIGYGDVYIIPELGLEYVPVPHGIDTTLPVVGLGIGVGF